MNNLNLGFGVKEILEGETRLLVPDLPPGSHPSKGKVFYNPDMKLNRDLTVSLSRVVKPKDFLDALSGSGAKGIRVMNESGVPVVFNDVNPLAVKLIKKNLELNGLKADVHNMDANILMRTSRYSFVDVDPFGSPARFVDSAACSVKDYLGITATDTAALTGTYPRSGLRKYGVLVSRTSFMHELGIRALIGFVVREFSKYALAVKPILSHSTLHYYRVVFSVSKGKMKATNAMRSLKWVVYDRKSDDRWYSNVQDPRHENYGPVWSREIFDSGVLSRMKPVSSESEKFLYLANQESDITMPYIDTHVLAKKYGINPLGIEKIIEALSSQGFTASRTHFCPYCIKSDAQPSEIASILNPHN